MDANNTLSFIEVLKAYWWLFGIIVALAGTLVRSSLRIHKATEELAQVALHDKDIKAIWQKTENIETGTKALKEQINGMKESLDAHVVDQKSDISVMTDTLFSILDVLRDIGGDALIVKGAHNQLRKHTIDK